MISFGIECACSLGQRVCLENCPTSFPAVVVTEYRDHTGPHLGLCKCFKIFIVIRFFRLLIRLGWKHLLLLTVLQKNFFLLLKSIPFKEILS